MLKKQLYIPKVVMCIGQTTALQLWQVGVIVLSLIVLIETGLLLGALVKIVLLTKRSET